MCYKLQKSIYVMYGSGFIIGDVFELWFVLVMSLNEHSVM